MDATDPDGDEIDNYHFQLSPYPDMRRPLSPNFDIYTFSGASQWEVPYHGLLNPDQSYYWRVRARDRQGVWSQWSPTWRFTPHGPGIPVEITKTVYNRTIAMSWKPNTLGNRPVRYEVYGSNEKGFTVSDSPYQVLVGGSSTNPGLETRLANLITTTEATSLTVVAAESKYPNTNCTFYRVVAVDDKGTKSGPSEYIEVDHPFIYSEPPVVATVGSVYTYQVGSTYSIGDLQYLSVDDNPKDAGYHDADVLRYALLEAPEWLSIDGSSGVISGTVQQDSFEVTVEVVDGQGRRAIQTWVVGNPPTAVPTETPQPVLKPTSPTLRPTSPSVLAPTYKPARSSGLDLTEWVVIGGMVLATLVLGSIGLRQFRR